MEGAERGNEVERGSVEIRRRRRERRKEEKEGETDARSTAITFQLPTTPGAPSSMPCTCTSSARNGAKGLLVRGSGLCASYMRKMAATFCIT